MDQHKLQNNTDEISLRDLVLKIKSLYTYLWSKRLVILIVSLIGCGVGFAYATLKKPVYTAECIFVLEEGTRAGGLGQYSSLASIAGLDIGGGGGMFQGDNILELYKSRSMIEKTLLSEATFNNKKQLLIDRYIEFNQLRDKWNQKPQTKGIKFNGNPDDFTRAQDSIITEIVSVFNKGLLFVAKPDKKLSIINVDVSSNDELFAREFTNKLVDNVNSFYITTKTKKTLQSVSILQHQADSVRLKLNFSIGGVASSIDANPNANPNMAALRVPAQRQAVDVQASTAIYTEIVRNLETSKFSLRQETPLIQIIDKPVLPLSITRVGKSKGILIGFFLGGILTVVFLSLKKALNNLMQ